MILAEWSQGFMKIKGAKQITSPSADNAKTPRQILRTNFLLMRTANPRETGDTTAKLQKVRNGISAPTRPVIKYVREAAPRISKTTPMAILIIHYFRLG
jgi:hypothetical protein